MAWSTSSACLAVLIIQTFTGFSKGFVVPGLSPQYAVPGMAVLHNRRALTAIRMQELDREQEQESGSCTRRSLVAGVSAAAVLLSSSRASALSWATVEKIAQDPSLLQKALDPTLVGATADKWRQKNLGVTAANAAEYTVEFEEFQKAVKKAGKAKIGDTIVENPTDEQLLQAWKVEEKRRADVRAKEGKEALTRPVKELKPGSTKDYVVKYLPPVVTNTSTSEAMALGAYLDKIGAKMFGAYWCSHCYGMKQQLGYEAVEKYLNYVECDKRGAKSQRDFCKEQKVPGFPTWQINGELFPGEMVSYIAKETRPDECAQTVEALADIAGFDLKTGTTKPPIKPPPLEDD